MRETLLSKVDSAGHGTGRITTDVLTSLEVAIPDLAEQQSISDLLSTLDDKIHLNRQAGATLEEMVRTLFRSWFIDFDPVHAKAQGHYTSLPRDILALFPDSFDDEGLPKGWHTKKVGDMFDIVAGNTPSTKEAVYWGGEHEWATPKDMSGIQEPFLFSTERSLSDVGLLNCSSGKLPSMSLLMSSRAPVGYLALNAVPVSINQGIAAFRKRTVSIVYAWAWCHENMPTIKSHANGSTFQEISKGTLRQIPMIEPSLEVHEVFAEIAERFFDRIKLISNETRELTTIRDALLPRLVFGELRVSDAENMIAAA